MSDSSSSPFYVNTAGRPKFAEANCEFCAAAGAVNLAGNLTRIDTGSTSGAAPRFTSTKAADYAGLFDTVQMGGDQVKRVAKFVCSHSGRKFVEFGASGAMPSKSYAESTEFMKNLPDHTVFVIWADGDLESGDDVSHWLNAIKVNGDIRYFDFQVNSTFFGGSKNPASCNRPFVGIETAKAARGSRALQSSDPRQQVGMFQTSTVKMGVLAFPPN